MKSKNEIIDALQIHMFSPDCKGCAYLTESNNHTHLCTRTMVNDVINTLSKSDFEVIKEVLDKSLILDWEHYSEDDDYYRTKRLSAKDACGTVYELAFDVEGNILWQKWQRLQKEQGAQI